MSKVSFVIPCYGSEKTLRAVIEELTDTMADINKYSYEVILVHDGSPDRTIDVIREICSKYEHVFGVDLARNFGQHSALMAGFHQVTGDIVVCLDDDGQTPANEVGKLLDKIEEGYDVVYAEYKNKKHSGFRNLGSKVNSLMTEYLLGKPKDLFVSSYFAARRFIINNVIQYENAYPYVLGLVLRTTKKIANVEVNHRSRMEGASGYSLKKLLALWANGFTSFSVKPLRIASFIGILFALMGFVIAIGLVINKLLHADAVLLGWSSTMAVMMILGGIVLLVLGIIGEYIGRIYICMNKAPQYIVREMIGGNDEADEK